MYDMHNRALKRRHLERNRINKDQRNTIQCRCQRWLRKKKNERTQKAAVLASIGKEQRAGKTGLTLLQGTSSRKMRDTHVRREHNTCICI